MIKIDGSSYSAIRIEEVGAVPGSWYVAVKSPYLASSQCRGYNLVTVTAQLQPASDLYPVHQYQRAFKKAADGRFVFDIVTPRVEKLWHKILHVRANTMMLVTVSVRVRGLGIITAEAVVPLLSLWREMVFDHVSGRPVKPRRML